MVVLVAIGASISLLNILFEFQGMRVATDPAYLAAVGTAGSTALAMLMLDLQHFGYAIAGIFFGLWLVPLGYLAFKSGMFPKVLGIVLVVGGIGYLFDTLATFVAPASHPGHPPGGGVARRGRRGLAPCLPPDQGRAESRRSDRPSSAASAIAPASA